MYVLTEAGMAMVQFDVITITNRSIRQSMSNFYSEPKEIKVH